MKSLIFLPLLLLGGAAYGQDNTPDGHTIVVTGKSLAETERALAECLARHCPPDQDIDASLSHAENLFVAGNYKEARRTTLAAIGRNAGQAKAYPLPVADLYRANGRIAAHLGEGHDYEWSTTGIKRALKAGLPRDDVRLIGADLESASMYASLGRLDRARQIYEEAERDSRKLGREDLAGTAKVRAAWLHQLAGDTWLARQALKEIAEDRTSTARVPRLTAMILLARLDRKEGKLQSSETLVEQLRGLGGTRPVLLFSPRIELPSRALEGESGSVTRLMATENFDDQWVDIGFWVTPDGRVSEPEVLRSRGNSRWSEPLLRSIAGRIYSPINDPTGSYRVERYSFTSLWQTDRTGTHLRQRSPDARIEFLDLTVEEPETQAR